MHIYKHTQKEGKWYEPSGVPHSDSTITNILPFLLNEFPHCFGEWVNPRQHMISPIDNYVDLTDKLILGLKSHVTIML